MKGNLISQNNKALQKNQNSFAELFSFIFSDLGTPFKSPIIAIDYDFGDTFQKHEIVILGTHLQSPVTTFLHEIPYFTTFDHFFGHINLLNI